VGLLEEEIDGIGVGKFKSTCWEGGNLEANGNVG